MKSTKELLRDKREGQAISSDEMYHFINGVVNSSVSMAQVGAFCMAACTRGLSPEETSALTMAMTKCGVTLPRTSTGRKRIDKHSTGGVGDKVSLLLAPLAASRGLGHTGGTLDKLESVPGFSIDVSQQEMDRCLQESGVFMAGQSNDLAPADRVMYAVRDVTGTVESVGLITASILSKKFAENLDGLVMDMKVGSAAFMQTLDQARKLAESMQRVCEAVGVPVRFVFTRMDEPLGYAVGNWLEIAEAEHALATSAERSLAEVTIELTSHMVHIAGVCSTLEQCRELVVARWRRGDAHQRFHHMISQQGGRWHEAVEHYSQLQPLVITAPSSGWINAIDAQRVATAVLHAGGGRMRENDMIDPAAGVVFHCERGFEVRQGDQIASVYASDFARRDTLAELTGDILKIETAPVERKPHMILEVW